MKKEYYLQHNIGKAKYVVSFHNGVKTHKDGSAFYDIMIFRNKPAVESFIKELSDKGYKER